MSEQTNALHLARSRILELEEALQLVRDLSSQEWQQPDGKRMGATDNSGRRMWFISQDVMDVARSVLNKENGNG